MGGRCVGRNVLRNSTLHSKQCLQATLLAFIQICKLAKHLCLINHAACTVISQHVSQVKRAQNFHDSWTKSVAS